MVNLIYCAPSFKKTTLLKDYITELSLNDECVELTSLSELEQKILTGKGLCLVFITDELLPLHQTFIERLLSNTALPIIVNAALWDESNLASLLSCGRVTFVPELLSAKRLSALLSLARIRFNSATSMLEKVKKLDEKCSSMRLVSKAKSILQLQGITEKVAHELIQQQAMSNGVTLSVMAKKIIVAAQQIEANPIGVNQDDVNRPHQFGANAPAVNRVVQ